MDRVRVKVRLAISPRTDNSIYVYHLKGLNLIGNGLCSAAVCQFCVGSDRNFGSVLAGSFRFGKKIGGSVRFGSGSAKIPGSVVS